MALVTESPPATPNAVPDWDSVNTPVPIFANRPAPGIPPPMMTCQPSFRLSVPDAQIFNLFPHFLLI
jgi:hypothetical protein